MGWGWRWVWGRRRVRRDGFRKGGEGREMEGLRGGRRRGEVKGRPKGREGRWKTKSGYAYVSAHRQTDTQTHKSENSISASFTPFTWRI